MYKENRPQSNFHYNRILKPLAKHMRNESTKGEIILWVYVLRARQLMGYQFFRQRTISKYIADFFCKELKLVIEVDGVTHLKKKSKDNLKDEELVNLGFNVIRIKDYDIFTDLHGVRQRMEAWIRKYERKHPEVLLIRNRKKKAVSSP